MPRLFTLAVLVLAPFAHAAPTGDTAGFDFTALDAYGKATTPGTHACVRDNVTGLIWSTETISSNWNDARAKTTRYARCGFTDGWRIPTRRELLSIVHDGTFDPAIATAYFPNTQSVWYWTADTYAPVPSGAWGINFRYGHTNALNKSLTHGVRFVRGGS